MQFFESEAREDFNRARKHAFFSEVFSIFSRDRRELLSLQEVREAIKPRGEVYRGMQAVPIDKIVGSEGRYKDFTKQFLPRHEYLRNRWQSVDLAHLSDVPLPAVSLYEICGVYFVRDGNHRVSVARSQGGYTIDAEVVSLSSEIPLTGELTREKLRSAVIERERRQLLDQLPLDELLPEADLRVTTTGRYDEIRNHILGHKYYMNEKQTVEIPLAEAAKSWYRNVYRPIIATIRDNRLMARFSGRTETDLYLWIVKHWHHLKARYGGDVPIATAVYDYRKRFGPRILARFWGWCQARLGRRSS